MGRVGAFMGTHGAEKHRRSTPAKMVSASMTLLAEDLPPVACLCCFPPSPRCLLNPREVASEGGGGKGQNSDLRTCDYLHLVISLLVFFAFVVVNATALVDAWEHVRS